MNLFILPGIITPIATRALRIKEVLGYMSIAGKKIKYVADSRKIKGKKKKINNQDILVA